MSHLTVHLHILGLVQGVGYRRSFCRQAEALAVGGWVRNRLDGSVEALVSGESAAVSTLQTWAQRGPSAAVVREVRATPLDATAIGELAADDLPGPTCLQRPTV